MGKISKMYFKYPTGAISVQCAICVVFLEEKDNGNL